MKTLRFIPCAVMLLMSVLLLNSSVMGQDEPKKTDDGAAKLTKQFEALATELEEDLDDLSDPLAAYAAEIEAQEKKLAELTKKHGADSKQAKRAAKILAEQKANLAAATEIVEDPQLEAGETDPLAAYADEIKKLEKRLASLVKKNGEDNKQVKRAQQVLARKKENLANLIDFVDDDPAADLLTADPLAAYAAEVKVLEKKLAEVSKKSGKDSKEAKQLAKALSEAKASLATANDPGNDDPAADLLTADPLAAYAAEVKALEKKLAEVSKKSGKESKEAKQLAKALSAAKTSLATANDPGNDDPAADLLTADPLAAYAAEVKALEKKLAEVSKKSGKESKEAKQLAKALSAAKASLAELNDPGDSPDVRIAELASRIAKCKDPKQKKELEAKLSKLKELLPQLNLGETELPEKK